MFKNALQIPIEVCALKHTSSLGDIFNLMEIFLYAFLVNNNSMFKFWVYSIKFQILED
jgi:hypothetical protein